MKKRMICLIMAILLVFFSAGTVFAADSGDNNDSTNKSEGNVKNGTSADLQGSVFGSSSSPQLALAMLQMELAKTNKEQALSGIKEIEQTQAAKKQVSDYLNTARELQKKAKNTGEKTQMPSEMAQFMNSKSLSYIADSNGYSTSEEWNTAIISLTTYQEQLGNNIQAQMIQLQDFMGQYNSYMQGANSAISQSNQVLSGLSRGQSMYGDSEVGLAVTGLVVGIVLGCLICLAVQKSRTKKETG